MPLLRPQGSYAQATLFGGDDFGFVLGVRDGCVDRVWVRDVDGAGRCVS